MVKKLVDTINYTLNAGRYFRTADAIASAINVGRLEYFKQIRGDVGFYRPMQPFSPTGFGQTSVNSDLLAPFLRTNTFTFLTDQVIFFRDPQGREIDSILSIRLNYGNVLSKGMRTYTPSQYSQIIDSAVIPPTQTQPYGLMTGDLVFDYEPKPATTFQAQYLVTPLEAIFTYTGEVVNGVPALTVQQEMDFPDIHLDQLLNYAMKYLGINAVRPDITQLANNETQKTV